MDRSIRGKYAVVGVGNTRYGKVPGVSALAHNVEAIANPVVELEEGPRLVTNLVNCTLDRIHMAMPVRVVYGDMDEEITLVTFEPDNND